MLPAIPAAERETNNAYFSPGYACQQAIISALANAKHSIKICVFTISDDQITKAILEAHQRQVPILVLTDNEKLSDVGSDIKELAKSGIEIRTDNTRNHMHHKFAIIDNTTLITGSYNWTRSAAMYNHENIIVTTNRSLLNDFLQQFEALWPNMTPFTAQI